MALPPHVPLRSPDRTITLPEALFYQGLLVCCVQYCVFDARGGSKRGASIQV